MHELLRPSLEHSNDPRAELLKFKGMLIKHHQIGPQAHFDPTAISQTEQVIHALTI